MVLVAHELLEAVVLETRALPSRKSWRRWQREGGIKTLNKPVVPSKVLPSHPKVISRGGKTYDEADAIRQSDISRAALRSAGPPIGCAPKQMGSGARAHGLRRGPPVVERASG